MDLFQEKSMFHLAYIDDLEVLLVTCLFIWVMLMVVERVLRTSCDHGWQLLCIPDDDSTKHVHSDNWNTETYSVDNMYISYYICVHIYVYIFSHSYSYVCAHTPPPLHKKEKLFLKSVTHTTHNTEVKWSLDSDESPWHFAWHVENPVNVHGQPCVTVSTLEIVGKGRRLAWFWWFFLFHSCFEVMIQKELKHKQWSTTLAICCT